MSAQSVFRYPDGIWPNILALTVTVGGWLAGMFLMTRAAWELNVLGWCMLTLSLIWSAYFIHEFAHHAIFRAPQTNERWGTLMSWINGSCYARFQDMRRKHMRHHVERADVITFDVRQFLLDSPAWFRRTVLALEWAYIPAVELLMHGFVMAQPFTDPSRRHQRLRVVGIGLIRSVGFGLLAWVSPKALLLYALAYLAFITVLRFADCFQHTYDAYPLSGNEPIPQDKLRDRRYEQQNTYSNVVGLNHPILNLLWLNFGYHNAHHERPTAPWHQLPRLHRQLFEEQDPQVIPVPQLLKSFHANRVRRILSDDYGRVLPPSAAGRADGFVGAVGVSFLTAV
ncbi:MAG: fatty acid desaturase [Burkholderiales bacterium]|nr:fatty acid desaturase [Burkholderiales bacterium]